MTTRTRADIHPHQVAEVCFEVDRTQINLGRCVTFWKMENVKAVCFCREGDRWRDHDVAGQGSQQECPPSGTAFYLRVVKPDEGIDLRQIALTVQSAPTATSQFDPLGGTRRRVRSYRDPASSGNLRPVLTGTTLAVGFGHDGKVPGSAGCNTYASAYMVQATLLTITLPTATSKLGTEPQDCPSGTKYRFLAWEVHTRPLLMNGGAEV